MSKGKKSEKSFQQFRSSTGESILIATWTIKNYLVILRPALNTHRPWLFLLFASLFFFEKTKIVARNFAASNNLHFSPTCHFFNTLIYLWFHHFQNLKIFLIFPFKFLKFFIDYWLLSSKC